MSKFLIIETQAMPKKYASFLLGKTDTLPGAKRVSRVLEKKSSFFEQAQKADKLQAALEKAQKIINDFCGETFKIVMDLSGDPEDVLDTISSEVEYISSEISGYQREFNEIKNDLIMLL